MLDGLSDGLTGALSPDEWRAVTLSLKVSFWATVLSLPFGIAVAYLLARREFWGKQALNGLVHLPLILPPVVTGYLLLLTFGRKGMIGGFLEQTGCRGRVLRHALSALIEFAQKHHARQMACPRRPCQQINRLFRVCCQPRRAVKIKLPE